MHVFLDNPEAILMLLSQLFLRELIWNLWKNEGCPSFVIKPKAEEEQDSAVPRASGKRKRKISLGDQVGSLFPKRKQNPFTYSWL